MQMQIQLCYAPVLIRLANQWITVALDEAALRYARTEKDAIAMRA